MVKCILFFFDENILNDMYFLYLHCHIYSHYLNNCLFDHKSIYVLFHTKSGNSYDDIIKPVQQFDDIDLEEENLDKMWQSLEALCYD